MTVRFPTRREDFPPNITELKIEHITLYVARKPGTTDEITVDLHFAPQEAPELRRLGLDGQRIVSTRQGNADGWTDMIGQSPVGKWTLARRAENQEAVRG